MTHSKIKRLLRAKKITYDKVGIAIGLEKASVSQRLNGKSKLTLEEMMIISGMLGVSMDELSYDDPRYTLDSEYIEFLSTYEKLDLDDKKRIIRMMSAFTDKAGD